MSDTGNKGNLFGLLIIFPFYLLMPRYYDFSPMLILSIILLSKPLYLLFEKIFEILFKFRSINFNLRKLEFDSHSLLIILLIFIMISTNIGETLQESFFDKDQTIQEKISYFDKNIPKNVTVICTPEFGSLLGPRIYVDQYVATLGNNYYLIFSIKNSAGPDIIILGVNSGSVQFENDTYSFTPLKRINDVTIYLITLN